MPSLRGAHAAREGELSPVLAAVIALPGTVPYGLHSAWVPYEELA